MTDLEKWLSLMRRGEFAEAWRVSDASLRDRAGTACWHLPRHEQWVWDGTPLNDQRVLVRCYHGLGDTLQFIRYLPLVEEIAKHVTVWAQPSLLPLLQGDVRPLHDGAIHCDYDVDVEVMELAHVFRSTIDTIPNDVPYIHATPVRIKRDRRLAVGIVWRSGDWDERRDVPFRLIESLADADHVKLFSLQRDPDHFSDRIAMLDGVDEPMKTAQLMRAMDLVITIDSMPAHLAGALGVPTWTLLPADADWRWMEHRDDSPWYPTMRLFRQQRPDDWSAVIERVRAALATIAAHGRILGNTAGEEAGDQRRLESVH
ncbi:MAG TPA: ADP-heptose--LPS heptosyltransferase [Thermoanaerobaculia bacterium]|nr:ADP-heptose--LPS heptosyltransferase [Thermoanaerobaculia bacterium]